MNKVQFSWILTIDTQNLTESEQWAHLLLRRQSVFKDSVRSYVLEQDLIDHTWATWGTI